MTSAAEIRRRTAEKLARPAPAAPPAARPANDSLDPSQLCITEGCGRRWTCNFARGRRCSVCDERMATGARRDPTRPLFTASGTPTTQETSDDEQLPF